MQHLNPFRFYELAAKLHGLFHASSQHRIVDMFGPLTEAQNALDILIKGDPFPLETSKADANRLLGKLANVFNRYYIDQTSKQVKAPTGEDRIDPHEVALLQSLLEKFEHALAADLNRSPTYTAEKRGIYSTYDLIEHAAQALPASLHKTVNSAAISEFSTAGRALAFGLGTAAAVHLLRAIELVLRQYFELYAGGPAAKNERNYALYLKKLTALADDENSSAKPDKRVIQMLAQIKDQYRNPLAVPDQSISVEQATALMGLATAIIAVMAEQIQAQQAKGSHDPKAALETIKTSLTDDEEKYEFKKAM
jgi:hypothetical protein